MKTNIYFIVIVFLLSSCVNVKNLKHVNEDKKLKNGVQVEITEANDVIFTHYKKGVKHGTEKTVYSSGAYSICRYKNGEKEGWYKMYDKQDKIMYKDFYKNDSMISTVKFFEPKLF